MAIGDHFYTINAAERDNAIASYGYRSDGTAGYVFGSDPSSLSPFYRLFHKRTGDHWPTGKVGFSAHWCNGCHGGV